MAGTVPFAQNSKEDSLIAWSSTPYRAGSRGKRSNHPSNSKVCTYAYAHVGEVVGQLRIRQVSPDMKMQGVEILSTLVVYLHGISPRWHLY